jgi:acetylornithine/succinyldiaminopimelate/putrescine aminotransferase
MTQRQLFLNHIAQTTSSPLMLEIVRAQGVFMFDNEGKQYIDMISGISVSNVGHCHPKVVEAIQKQSETFMHLMVYGEYIYSPQVLLAQELLTILPNSLDNFYFTNSGTEAVEGALKLAKRSTGRHEIISFKNAYHGSTAGALSIMGSETYKMNYRPLIPGHSHIAYNHEPDLEKITPQTAAVVVEMVQAEAGIVPGHIEFIQKLKAKCQEVGALLIADEIQTGCGRTGRFFAFEHYSIVPDILLIGKGFGGGMPIAAFIANKELMAQLSHNPILGHLSTFGGNAVCCAAALATIKVIKEEISMHDVESKGAYLQEKLEAKGYKNIRRKGLMMSIDFGSQEKNFEAVADFIQKGVITDWFLFNTQSMRICPPLNISYDELDWAIAKF